MKRILSLAAALAFGIAGRASAQDSTHVVLDGRFDEWEGVAPVLQDPADGRAPYPDILAVQARADVDAGFLNLTLREPVVLQSLPAPMLLLVDFGGPMGGEVHGMRGVDAVLEFSGGRPGAGVWLRRIDGEGRVDTLVSANETEMMIAPSHVSRRFEIRLRRGGPLNIGGQIRFRFVVLDSAGGVADETEAFTADFSSIVMPPLEPGGGFTDPLARAPGTDLRVVSWNVGRETMFRQPDAFGAILRALDPDLLLLDEVAGGHSAPEVQALLDRILPGDEPWHVVYGTSGGSQRGVIAARGTAPEMARSFMARLPYPDSARDVIGDDTAAAAQGWLRSRLEVNVPATGALVTLGGRRLLGVTLDLESGGALGSPKDRLRRIEALRIRDAVAQAIAAGGVDGVLVAGDFNLVASPDPLQLLATGLDVDGSDLHVPTPLRLDGASALTWENPEEPFTPSRLDFVLVGDAALAVTGGFIFRAGDLTPRWLETHGLTADASRVTDHLPVVTDLRWTVPVR
ncbi:endonuclease/exonuclease/phosphatase family protein [Longimicrobium sp.]|uniref:endonuclease/exonuclease/phosphatase family protein n=1 Tax=Longimicrobium sp. TaxID=2029185 RepID=UPI002E33C6E4|nr:endonuclease/exonuclease/phosphatase family protein [Longimicrobium sp.]HEX6037466.1 endonuclease/exonuclease/phosphatase family protein [Longimicrobium sp.]